MNRRTTHIPLPSAVREYFRIPMVRVVTLLTIACCITVAALYVRSF